MSEWFLVNVGLRQGCVMSPWLFNIYYMNGVAPEANAEVLEKRAGTAECVYVVAGLR